MSTAQQVTAANARQDLFVDLVDFKWLMAGVGWWVNLSRLQQDAAYAQDCLQRALSSGLPLLRERGAALLSPAPAC